MKKNITKVVALLLVIVTVMSALPFAAFANNGADTAGEANSYNTAIENAMAEREHVVKDRENIPADCEAAVFVNGKVVYSGDFVETWQKTLSKAPHTVRNPDAILSSYSKLSDEEIEALDLVEFVLNKDITYESAILGEDNFKRGALYIAHQKVTIDLNGHVLRRTDTSATFGSSLIYAEDYTLLTIMDSDPDKEHKGKIKDNLWVPDEKGTVIIKGGVLCGGVSILAYGAGNYGGGLFINDSSTVIMTGGSIAGNRAAFGSGVALGESCTLDMSIGTSQICYNYTDSSTSDGGAIFALDKSTIKGGYIHHNVADDYGGGIRTSGGKITVSDSVIYANHAKEYGGGIYIERTDTDQSVTFENCHIVGNYAGERGGGAYVYNINKAIMTDCTVINNASSEHGGGICISDHNGSDLEISGLMTVCDNFKSSKKALESGTATEKSNLYIQGNDDLIVGSLTYGSEVWVRTGKSAKDHSGINKRITENPTSASELWFFCDNTEYYVAYQNDPALDNYRHLYLVKGERPKTAGINYLEDFAVKRLSTDYKVETGVNKDKEFPLYRGIFEYNLKSTREFFTASPFYYSDGYFFEDAKEYNRHLATMSLNMALAAFGRQTDLIEGNRYANHFANIKQLMSDIGCDDADFFANEDYHKEPEFYGGDDVVSTIGVAISKKEISLDGESYTLVPVAIRGGGYGEEWASNFLIGDSGEARGFSNAAGIAMGHVKDYVETHGLEDELESGRVKFWVVGYSRGGAVANLTSKRLIDLYAPKGNQVFGYTFEAPRGGVPSEIVKASYTYDGEYSTIHNTVNENDFVTLIAPAEMGFIRYGKDHLIGSDYEGKEPDPISYDTGSDYYAQRMKMIAQLAAINPYYKFNDEWEIADVNIILSKTPLYSTDLIDKGHQDWDDPNPEAENSYDYLRWAVEMLQLDGFEVGPAKFREHYANGTPLDKVYPTTASALIKKLGEWGIDVSSFIDAKEDEEILAEKEELVCSDISIQDAVICFMELLYGMPEEEKNAIIDILMGNVTKVLGEKNTIEMLGFYFMFKNWTNESIGDRQDTLYILTKIVWGDSEEELKEIVGDETFAKLKQAVPTLLYFALNYASADYAEEVDDGMWGVGTFINNMTNLVANHNQEITAAWVRSYDSFYDNDLVAYTLENTHADKPRGVYSVFDKTLKLEAEPGSSIFYSIDGGSTWTYYSGPVSFEEKPESIKAFAISRGAKSEIEDVPMNPWAGTLIGEGRIWFVVAGSVAIVAASVAALEVKRRKKKSSKA